MSENGHCIILRKEARAWVERFRRLELAIDYTDGKKGADGAAARHSWNKEARLLVGDPEVEADLFADRLVLKNPIIALRASQAFGFDCDSPDDVVRVTGVLKEFDAPRGYEVESSPGKLHIKYRQRQNANRAFYCALVEHGEVTMKSDQYFVTAPGTNSKTGELRKVIHDPVELPELPDAVYSYFVEEARKQQREQQRVLDNDPEARVVRGRRHTYLLSLAGSLRSRGVREEDALAVTLKTNEARCDPPMPVKEASEIVHDVYHRYDDGFHAFLDPEPLMEQNSRHFVGFIERDGGRLPRLSDQGVAEVFERNYGDQFVWNVEKKCWLRHHGGVFRATGADELALQAMLESMRAIAAKVKERAEDDPYRKAAEGFCLKGATIDRANNARRVATTRPRLRTNNDEFDTHPTLLAAANGVVDLKTGELLPHDPALRFSVGTPVAYDPSANAPRFERFLREVLVDEDYRYDPELAEWVWRWVGYCTTGLTSEELLAIWLGTARNGKGALWEAITAALGREVATTAAMDTFLRWRGGRDGGAPRPDIIALDKARIVSASEANKAAALDQATLKALSGGDPISGRTLYAKTITFTPQFKLNFQTNDALRINSADLAVVERLRVIPFYRFFDRDERDETLKETLREEAPGILAFLVRGARAYLKDGLGTCAAVEEATARYVEEHTPLDRWVKECVTLGEGETEPAELWESYAAWHVYADNPPEQLNKAEFRAALLALPGVKFTRSNGRRLFRGVEVRGQ